MLKLSRRRWNNILIFVVLILMYSLYDWSGTKLDQTTQPMPLVPEQAQLLSVSVANQRLVRVAGQWQLQPGGVSANAQQMASAWQFSILPLASAQVQPNWVPVAQASLQLVGEVAPQIWLLYPDPTLGNAPSQPSYLLQQVGQSSLYQLNAAQARLLFLLE